jgi:hypothetical protein
MYFTKSSLRNTLLQVENNERIDSLSRAPQAITTSGQHTPLFGQLVPLARRVGPLSIHGRLHVLVVCTIPPAGTFLSVPFPP